MARAVAGTIVVSVGALALAGCQTDTRPDEGVVETFADYVRANDYEPFKIPRDNFGTGTIVTFEKKREDVSATNDECFRLALKNGYDEANVTLPNTTYTVTTATDLAATLAKTAIENVDLSGAFKDARVTTISISITDPKETIASGKTLDDRVRKLIEANEQSCVRRIFDKKNYVIDRVLSVKGVTIQFKDKSDRAIKIDAGLRDVLGLKAETNSGLDGQASIQAQETRMVGYRLWQYTGTAGMGESDLKRVRVNPQNIQAVRDGG